MYPGAIEAFDRAIAVDPSFALAHTAKAHALLERGDAAAARASMAAANSLTAGLSAREASHVAFFDLLVAGDAEAALAAVLAHVDAWPRDAVVLATTGFTNGLIGSSGRAEQKPTLLDLLENLAPIYGDDWWFTAHHGMALSENDQRSEERTNGFRGRQSRPLGLASLARQQPRDLSQERDRWFESCSLHRRVAAANLTSSIRAPNISASLICVAGTTAIGFFVL